MTKTATIDILKKLSEQRSELEGLGDKLNGLRAGDWSANEAEIRSTMEQINALDVVTRVTQRSAEIELMAEPGDGPKGGTRQANEPDYRTIGQRVVDDEGYRNWNGTGSAEVRITSTGGISAFGSAAANGAGLLRPLGTPVLPPQTIVRQRLFLRDLLDVTPTGLASVPYIKELNAAAYASAASGAQFVAEGAQKPEVGLDFQPADAPIRKIAAWMQATYEILQDAPTLRGYIDGRLQYMLALAEERGLLNGNGTAPNLRGILQSSPQAQAFSTDPFVSLGLAMGKLEVAQGEPSFVAMHPTDFWAMQTTRFANHFEGSQGSTAQNSPFGGPQSQVWGVPVVRTVGVTAGSALVGCRQGAVILDREQPVIRVGDQHLDYFTTNRVAILIEERIGLAVHRPDWFCTVALA